MKKFLTFLIFIFFWNNIALATDKTMEELLSDNYKITKEELIKFDRYAHKVFTLKKRSSVIVCSIKISRLSGIKNYSKCMTP